MLTHCRRLFTTGENTGECENIINNRRSVRKYNPLTVVIFGKFWGNTEITKKYTHKRDSMVRVAFAVRRLF